MKCQHCGLEHQDWLEHTSYEHLGVKACLVSLKRSEVVKAEGDASNKKDFSLVFATAEDRDEAARVLQTKDERFFKHTTDVVHCRATSSVGPALGASAAWEVGVPVSFMFMPAGTHTITAGFRKGSIELTVQCDESTAKAVQASLDAWRAERPKQQPFGCIEHREHEASVCVSASCGFEWKEDGVYLAAEPTSLGANNVNGKVHRSWSPSFTTDADYAKATEDGGTLRFPEGVRGSRSNPAQITGVDFCVGTLTNRPAFIEMKPVKAREADAVTAAGTSEGAKKGWQSREGLSAIGAVHDTSNVKIGDGIKNESGGETFHIKHKLGGEVHADQVKEIHRRVADHLEASGFKKKNETHGALHGVGSAGHSNAVYENSTHQVHLGGTGFSNRDWNGYIHIQPKRSTKASDATASAAVRASGGSFNTVLARESDAEAILDKIVARNKPKPVTVDQLNAKFGQTKTGDTRKTPDEILAGIYARAGLSR